MEQKQSQRVILKGSATLSVGNKYKNFKNYFILNFRTNYENL